MDTIKFETVAVGHYQNEAPVLLFWGNRYLEGSHYNCEAEAPNGVCNDHFAKLISDAGLLFWESSYNIEAPSERQFILRTTLFEGGHFPCFLIIIFVPESIFLVSTDIMVTEQNHYSH